MGENTSIEWAKHTGNLWWGCQEVHEGCDQCYARVFDKRVGGAHWGAHAPRRIIESVWANFTSWQKKAAAAGEVHRVFVGSMMDIFEVSRPTVTIKGEATGIKTGALRDRFFNKVVPASPNLLFLLLTKRPQNIRRMVPPEWLTNPPANVMYGYSAVNQKTADQGIPHLLAVPGRHFLSCEPLLGPLDISFYFESHDIGADYTQALSWVICGGESGHKARPMHPDWARSLRDQCQAAGVPFHFKQWGNWVPISQMTDDTYRAWDVHHGTELWGGDDLVNVGKKAAGRLLDGREWNEFPVTEPA